MQDAFAEALGLSNRMNLQQMCQFIVGMHNFLFPQKDDTVLCSVSSTSDVAAEKFLHTAMMHTLECNSTIANGDEEFHDKHHAAIGESKIQTTTKTIINIHDLQSAMQLLFGPDAKFTCPSQKGLVEHSAAMDSTQHACRGLPCGSGKSVSWTAPLIAGCIVNKETKMQVIVVPCAFLAGCHSSNAKKILEDLFGMNVLMLAKSDVVHCLPDCLDSDGACLPDLLFVTIDGLDQLLKEHESVLTVWQWKKLVGWVFIDELQTLFCELFHDACTACQHLAKFRFPATCLSGNTPFSLVPQALAHCGLHDTQDEFMGDVNVFLGGDVMGEFPVGFNFSCHVSQNVCRKAVSVIDEQMSALPGFGMHVIVSSKSAAQTVCDVLSMKHSLQMIASDNTKEEQVSVAKEWSEGRFDMLVSTTVTLVGNENEKCHAVIVVGMLFNLFSVAQAFCRLHPKQ